MYKEKIKELVLSPGRKGMDKIIEHMENEGFFTAPAECVGYTQARISQILKDL